MTFVSLEHRSIISIFTRKGNGSKVVREWMYVMYEDADSFEYRVKYWSKQFKWDRKTVEVDPRPGRLAELTALEMCQKMKSWPGRTGS
jgi:hypothetical protein